MSANSWSSSLRPMLDAHLAASPDSRYVGRETVRVETLDAVFDRVVRPGERAWLKVDTQGHERDVLTGAVTSLAFAPDGSVLVSASTDQTVRIWSLDDLSLQATLLPFEDEAVVMLPDDSLRFSPGGAEHIILVQGASWSPLAGTDLLAAEAKEPAPR